MRIVCPSCAAEYEVPAERLRPRRMVRCARCGGEWMPVREAEMAPPPPIPVPPPAPPPEMAPLPAITALDRLSAPPLPAPPARGGFGLAVAWVLSVAVLAGAVAATIVLREEIVRVWPPSARILG